jgi:DNA invertase Pin-like site-specific DNA recombinase
MAVTRVLDDWRIVAHQEDRATGTKLERPGLQAALDLARDGRIDLLLVHRVDRLSRKVRASSPSSPRSSTPTV